MYPEKNIIRIILKGDFYEKVNKNHFRNTKNEVAGFNFCECIHKNGKPLDQCLDELEKAKKE